MKRSNAVIEEDFANEFPKEVWLNVFSFLGYQKLLPLKQVSLVWNQWILEEGLTELGGFKHNFLGSVKNITAYKKLDSLTIWSESMKKSIFWKRGAESFSRLKNVFLSQNASLPIDAIYWKGFLQMTNLVSLRISISVNVPENIIDKLPNLRNLVVFILRGMTYTWISKLTQIHTLALTTSSTDTQKPTNQESDLLSNSLCHLSQLQVLEFLRVNTNYSFISKMTQLKRLVFTECSDENGRPSFADVPLSSLHNLEYFKPPDSPSRIWSMKSFKKMTHLQCLTLPTIPIDISVLHDKTNLKHIRLFMHYNYFIQDMRPLTKFLDFLPDDIKLSLHLHSVPNDHPNLDNTYFHLLKRVAGKRKFFPCCPHCQAFGGTFAHFEPRDRKFFDVDQ